MKFTVKEIDYKIDQLSITFDEGEEIELLTGLGWDDFGNQLRAGSLRAIRAIIYTAIKRVNVDFTFEELGSIAFNEIGFTWDDEVNEKKDTTETPLVTEEVSI
jgi:hypothetical protein